jgi:hypothetical protein
MTDNIIIVDDFIPLEEQEWLKGYLLSRMFPWFYVHNITNANTTIEKPALSHVFKDKGVENSSLYSSIEHIGLLGAARYDPSYNNVYHVRSFLQLPTKANDPNHLHVDIDLEHVVVLYYVTDSDGDTIIVDRKVTEYSQDPELADCTILHRVTPKQGRALIFNGAHYHASSTPKDSVRCILNFDVIK